MKNTKFDFMAFGCSRVAWEEGKLLFHMLYR